MTTLFFVRGALPPRRAGIRVLALDAAAPPDRDDVVEAARCLTAADDDAIEDAVARWTKAVGRTLQAGGVAFRDGLRWKGVPLWYFAELYLHHSTGATRNVRRIELFHRLFDVLAPERVDGAGLDDDETALLFRVCAARSIAWVGAPPSVRARRGASWSSRWNNLKTVLAALKNAASGGVPSAPGEDRRPVVFLSHAAFWRRREGAGAEDASEYEQYFDRLIPAVARDPQLRPIVLAVGPRAAHRRRGLRQRLSEWLGPHRAKEAYVPINRFVTPRVARETLRASGEIRRFFRGLRHDSSTSAAFSHRGVVFGDLSAEDLASTLLLQLPWAVRSYEETREALRAMRPAALALYAESSGWGRVAIAAARAENVPTVAIQHGIVYPRYYSYRHDADETECPLPDVTAVFGLEAQRLLKTMGRYPDASLVVTGSPKFDDLLERSRSLDAHALRQKLGLEDGDALIVVASRYRGIRETHRAIGSVFDGFVRAVESLRGVRAVVKPHPAEPAAPYERAIAAAGARHVQVVSSATNLNELLVAGDVLVTVESLSAVEALVLDRPVVVLNMPTNLASLVASGAARGVEAGADPAPTLKQVLFDEPTQKALASARRAYLGEVAHGVDGHATERILDLIRRVAAR